MRIIVTTVLVLMLSCPALAQEGEQGPVDAIDRYNARLDNCAICYQVCAHRWDKRRLSKDLERTGARARKECEGRCAEFMRLGRNECRAAYLGTTLGARN